MIQVYKAENQWCARALGHGLCGFRDTQVEAIVALAAAIAEQGVTI